MDKLWLKNYQPGVEQDIDIDSFRSIDEVFERSVAKFRSRPAMANMGKVLSYGDLNQHVAEFASFLQHRLGLKRGDRVALMMPNLLQYPIGVFGTLRAGLTVV